MNIQVIRKNFEKNLPSYLRLLAIILCIHSLLLLNGCGASEKTVKETVNTKTSEEMGLYTYNETVVNYFGEKVSEYIIDGEGNICSLEDSSIKISREKAEEYIFATSLQPLMSNSSLTITLHEDDNFSLIEQKAEFRMYMGPTDTTNKHIVFESSNMELLEFEQADVETENGTASVFAKCKGPGTVSISVISGDGTQTYRFNVSILREEREKVEKDEETTPEKKQESESPINTNPQTNPSRAEDIIATTKSEKGWIKKDGTEFREKPNSTSKIISTYDTGKEVLVLSEEVSGWIKCSSDNIIGYIKAEGITFTQPSIPESPAPSQDPTINIDNGFVQGSQNEQEIENNETENHVHYFQPVMENGELIYKCDCGKTYKGNRN